MKAVIQLVNHKDINTIVTCLDVASSCYRRWRETARSLSHAMVERVRRDAVVAVVVEANFSPNTTYQKHCPDLGSDTSSV